MNGADLGEGVVRGEDLGCRGKRGGVDVRHFGGFLKGLLLENGGNYRFRGIERDAIVEGSYVELFGWMVEWSMLSCTMKLRGIIWRGTIQAHWTSQGSGPAHACKTALEFPTQGCIMIKIFRMDVINFADIFTSIA